MDGVSVSVQVDTPCFPDYHGSSFIGVLARAFSGGILLTGRVNCWQTELQRSILAPILMIGGRGGGSGRLLLREHLACDLMEVGIGEQSDLTCKH